MIQPTIHKVFEGNATSEEIMRLLIEAQAEYIDAIYTMLKTGNENSKLLVVLCAKVEDLKAQLTPQPIENPDWGDVEETIMEYYQKIANGINPHQKEFEQQAFEQALTAVYGLSIHNWIEEREKKLK